MDGAFNARRQRRRPRINITSLIDVMFLLLIFFMVSSTFRHSLGIEVDLPRAETAADQETARHEIVISADGEFFFGQQLVTEDGLRAGIRDVLAGEPSAVLVLRADERADFGQAVRAMDIAREVGGGRLVIPTRLPGEAP